MVVRGGGGIAVGLGLKFYSNSTGFYGILRDFTVFLSFFEFQFGPFFKHIGPLRGTLAHFKPF